MAGSIGGCDSWFNNPANTNSSAHKGVSLAGAVHNYVKDSDRSWANGVLEAGTDWQKLSLNPNHVTISIETEDLGLPQTDVSVAQYTSVKNECIASMKTYPSIQWLFRHSDISPISKPSCPGIRWSAKFVQLAKELGLNYF